MTSPNIAQEAARLRAILLSNSILNLEILASIARLLREYGHPITPELINSLVLAVQDELVGTSALNTPRIPPQPGQSGGVPPQPGNDLGVPPQPGDSGNVPPQPGQIGNVPPQPGRARGGAEGVPPQPGRLRGRKESGGGKPSKKGQGKKKKPGKK